MRFFVGQSLRSSTAVILSLLTVAVALLPFFWRSEAAVDLLRHLMAVALVVSIWLAADRPTIPVVVTVIAVLHSAFSLWTSTDAATIMAEQLLAVAFVLATAGYLIHRLWTVEQVAASSLVVATAVYFLLGLFWSSVFSAMEMQAPGSFANACLPDPAQASCRPESGQFPRLAYFSFVTLTTLGYGDVVPLTSPAEGAATMAAVSGQLFMAVLVGRLVGSFLAARHGGRSDGPGTAGNGR